MTSSPSIHIHNTTHQFPLSTIHRKHQPRHHHHRCHTTINSHNTTNTPSSTQSSERTTWQTSVRDIAGRTKHKYWQPSLHPPALLSDVAVILISPKRPTSVGSVARALSCFECEDLRIVQPQSTEHHLSRSARNSSKGAQYLLWRATMHGSLESALEDSYASIAFTRWTEKLTSVIEFSSLPSLYLSHNNNDSNSSSGIYSNGYNNNNNKKNKKKLVLVFGREVHGLTDDEINTCSHACSIPIGRLQESLSLSHATTLALSSLFNAKYTTHNTSSDNNSSSDNNVSGWSGVVRNRDDLAVGITMHDD